LQQVLILDMLFQVLLFFGINFKTKEFNNNKVKTKAKNYG